MVKQNNLLTELQALEGIYEHLSTIDNLAKEVGAISTRLRKIEERLNEPVDITDPILGQGLTRDTCIHGALSKSMEACREVKEQKRKLKDITFELKQVKSWLDYLSKEQSKQSNVSEELMDAVKENTERIITHSKLIMAMLIVIAFAFVFTIVLR